VKRLANVGAKLGLPDMFKWFFIISATALLVGCSTTPPTLGNRVIHFSGYDWRVKQSDHARGPGPNLFSDSKDSVWLDASHQLHLTIGKRGGQWQCSEVVMTNSLGYGTYTFELHAPVRKLDPDAVIGLFTWSDAPAQNHREIDVEIGRWGDPTNHLGQFVIQPYDRTGNMHRFAIPEGVRHATFTFEWRPDGINFSATSGRFPCWFGQELGRWAYDGPDLPTPGDENVRINFWMNRGRKPQTDETMELVIRKFSFVPRR
jgi:hypothetical protein